MKKFVKVFLIAIIIGLTGFTSCEKNDDLQITWVKTTIMSSLVNSYITYGYGSGIRVSWTWHSKFMVNGDEDGEIEITANGPDNKETCVKFVESGITYKISVTGSVSSKESSCDVFLESPSFETFKIVSTDFKTNVQEIILEELD
jgi:hypothetical protein